MKKERVDKKKDTVDEQDRRGFFAYLNRHPIQESALIALLLRRRKKKRGAASETESGG